MRFRDSNALMNEKCSTVHVCVRVFAFGPGRWLGYYLILAAAVYVNFHRLNGMLSIDLSH